MNESGNVYYKNCIMTSTHVRRIGFSSVCQKYGNYQLNFNGLRSIPDSI